MKFGRGELHPSAKLSDARLSELRRRAHTERQAQLAVAYGLSAGHVCDLVHQRRRASANDLPPPERRPDYTLQKFRAQIEVTPGCHYWRGDCSEERARCWHRGKRRYACDVAYELFIGQIPNGMRVRLVCGNRFCVKPEHLELGPRGCRHARGARHPRWRGGHTISLPLL